ncbi:MAG: hypothetical protein HRT66_01285 [Flavobacteriaceae bacterium]|nr:hypothetical protein [Flavobacteriaceae bacterium]
MPLFKYCFIILFAVSVNSQVLPKEYTRTNESDLLFGDIKSKLELEVDFDSNTLKAKQWISLSPLFYKQNNIALDAKNMKIENVLFFGKKVKYNYYKDKIYIDFDRFYTKNESLDIYIEYTTDKKNTESKQGIKFTDLDKTKSGFKFVSSQQSVAGSWFVTIDRVGQRSEQDLWVKYPGEYKSVSNGSLKQTISNDDGTKTDHWLLSKNVPVSSMFLGIGDFEMKTETVNDIDINYFYSSKYRQKDCEAQTKDILQFIEKDLNINYPFETLNVVLDENFNNITKPFASIVCTSHLYGYDFAINDRYKILETDIVYSLFYQVFGNSISVKNIDESNMSIGLSRYSVYLWLKHKYDDNTANLFLDNTKREFEKAEFKDKSLISDFDFSDKSHSVLLKTKGMYLFHLISDMLGDNVFADILSKYNSDYKNTNNLNSNLFENTIKDITGKDLDILFDQWNLRNSSAQMNISKSYDLLEKSVTIYIKQSENTFYFPLEIKVYEKNNIQTRTVFVNEKESLVKFYYKEKPRTITVNSNNIVLAKIHLDKNLTEYAEQFLLSDNFHHQRESLELLKDKQEEKRFFMLYDKAINSKDQYIVLLGLNNINLSLRYNKRETIEKIEELANNSSNNTIKAAAIRVLGRFTDFKYLDLFKKNMKNTHYEVVGESLMALYYIDANMALGMSENIDKNIKKHIETTLSMMYIEERNVNQMSFVASRILNGMFATDKKIKKTYNKAFDWIIKSNDSKSIENLLIDMVEKGIEYRHYNFHIACLNMMRKMVETQDKSKYKNKQDNILLIKRYMAKLL